MGRMSSKKPNVQRKRQFGAPLHLRWKRLHARLDKPLRERYGRNAAIVHKGDMVRMMRGTAIINDNVTRHVDAKVAEVDLKRGKLYLENVTRKTAKGKQVWVPVDPSNVIITKLELVDPRRRERLEAGKE